MEMIYKLFMMRFKRLFMCAARRWEKRVLSSFKVSMTFLLCVVVMIVLGDVE